MKAYSGKVLLGHMSTRLLLITNSADVMFMFFLCCSLMSVELDYFFGGIKELWYNFLQKYCFFRIVSYFCSKYSFYNMGSDPIVFFLEMSCTIK
jgi:hypothetical protein